MFSPQCRGIVPHLTFLSKFPGTTSQRFPVLPPSTLNHSTRPRSTKSRSSTEWLSRQSRDPFVKQKTAEHGAFRARSAFKLLQLDEQFRFLNAKGVRTVVDLGAAPGGWSQVAAKRMGLDRIRERQEANPPKPVDEANASTKLEPLFVPRSIAPRTPKRVIAVDLLPMKPIDGVDIIQGDFLAPSTRTVIESMLDLNRPRVEVILSDMAPNMSGNRMRDIECSLELARATMAFARSWLVTAEEAGHQRGGVLVMKFFQHPDLDEFRKSELEPSFKFVRYCKPDSSRSESSEGYWVCSGFCDTVEGIDDD